MNARVLLGGVLGGVVMFFWGFVYWALLPVPEGLVKTLPHEAATLLALDAAVPETGTYVFPARDKAASMKERYAQGPLGVLAIRKGGADMDDPMLYLKGLLHFMACSAVALGIMSTVIGSLPTYASRARFVFRLGLFAGVAIEFAKVIWFYAPADFILRNCVFHFVGWGLVGLATANVVKPRPAAAT